MNAVGPTSPDAGIDLVALRGKYAEERAKRLRDDGVSQYIEMTGDFGHYVDDPWADPAFTRPAVSEDVDVIVVGGGFGGLCTGARLRQLGIDDFRIIEKGGDFGGAWYYNRYPGVQCDIESYCYLPLLEETGYVPKEKYSYGPEIYEHCQRIAKTFGLYDRALLQTAVAGAVWSEAEQRWRLTTNRGDEIRARVVIQTTGTLDKPKLPGIPGILDFKGHTFHTSRWDYGYTGGDTTGGLAKLADKRVAIIGTGATAIQAVPFLARDAGRLYVVQRTPSSVGLRGNKPTDPEWAKSLRPGWQRERIQNFIAVSTGLAYDVDLVDDGWTKARRALGSPYAAPAAGGETPNPDEAEILDARLMDERRERIGSTVTDGATADALKPWYRYFCKRPAFNDGYLDAFNRPNVTLLADPMGPERITETGLVIGGQHYEVDCIIFASGFEVGTTVKRRAGFDFIGVDGKTLSKEWERSFRSLHGVASQDFPNLLHVGYTQNATSLCQTCQMDELGQHAAHIVKAMQQRGATRFEPTADAERAWGETIRSKQVGRGFEELCTPSYLNREGRRGDTPGVGIVDEIYGGGPVEFSRLLETWRADGMPGFEFA
jgi:cyclohexanone monooxygenase